MATRVFYHSADLDGHCSGAIVKYAFPDSILRGINYGQPFPWEEIQPDDMVFMVDFSLQPFDDMIKLQQKCAHFRWIDHHKSAILDWENYGQTIDHATLDTKFAACELAWESIVSNRIPEVVMLLGRYDIWKHSETPGSLEFQYGMRMYDTHPERTSFWQRLFEDDGSADSMVAHIKREGALLLRYENEQNRKFANAFAFECKLGNLNCIAINKGFTNSLVFDSVYDPQKHDAMLAFSWRNGQWNISLYSDKQYIDCSEICKLYGGGGHKGAAGFQCKDLPFIPNAYLEAIKSMPDGGCIRRQHDYWQYSMHCQVQSGSASLETLLTMPPFPFESK